MPWCQEPSQERAKLKKREPDRPRRSGKPVAYDQRTRRQDLVQLSRLIRLGPAAMVDDDDFGKKLTDVTKTRGAQTKVVVLAIHKKSRREAAELIPNSSRNEQANATDHIDGKCPLVRDYRVTHSAEQG
jgi:hypothetical protein